MAVDIDVGRLRWLCRRGMKELDTLFNARLDVLAGLGDPAALLRFHRLLECEDDQLWRWCLGHGRPDDPELAAEIDAIRAGHPH